VLTPSSVLLFGAASSDFLLLGFSRYFLEVVVDTLFFYVVLEHVHVLGNMCWVCVSCLVVSIEPVGLGRYRCRFSYPNRLLNEGPDPLRQRDPAMPSSLMSKPNLAVMVCMRF
jgi:hypothetical protein